MSEQSFSLTFTAEKSPEEVFEAITNVRGWWSETIDGGTHAVGEEFTYRHKELHYSKHKLTELRPAEKVVWLVEDANLSFTKDKGEWKGTHLRFEIAKKGSATEVRFTHEGLTPSFECFGACSKGWTFYVGKSLRALIERGHGEPDRRGT